MEWLAGSLTNILTKDLFMYKIMGGDQKEYGPVSAEDIRQWIAEGRANAQTLVQAPGSADWKPLSAFPEFAAALAAKAAPAIPPPRIGVADPDKLAGEVLARGYTLNIGDCFSRSWELLKRNFWPVVATSAIFLVLTAGLGFIPILGYVASLVLSGVLQGGLCWFFLKQIRGQSAEVGDVFAGFNLAFVQLMLVGVVSSLLTTVGMVCCILPGIYLYVSWLFNLLLVTDKGLEFWPAMEVSRKVVTRNWWSVFGFVVVALLVNLAGVIACGIGVFVSIPLTFGATVYAYEDIFNPPAAKTAELPALAPPTQPAAS